MSAVRVVSCVVLGVVMGIAAHAAYQHVERRNAEETMTVSECEREVEGAMRLVREVTLREMGRREP